MLPEATFQDIIVSCWITRTSKMHATENKESDSIDVKTKKLSFKRLIIELWATSTLFLEKTNVAV